MILRKADALFPVSNLVLNTLVIIPCGSLSRSLTVSTFRATYDLLRKRNEAESSFAYDFHLSPMIFRNNAQEICDIRAITVDVGSGKTKSCNGCPFADTQLRKT
jgi:hypothetical protein